MKNKARQIGSIPEARLSSMPGNIKPMLATLVDRPFSDQDWLFETKWDGVRVLVYRQGGKIKMITRNGKEVAFRYPELAGIAGSIGAKEFVLDGEIVTFDEKGRSVFQWLQSRIGLKGKSDIAQQAREHPVVYCVFDLLYCDGYDLRRSPLASRKEQLAGLLRPSDHIRLSEHIVGEGEKRFREAQKARLEGLIAKLASSPYEEGRSSLWLKIKTVLRQEVVIAGYTAPRGSRKLFGALVVGLYEGRELRYVGHVGGGFTHRSLEQVHEQLHKLKTSKSPFAAPPPTNEPVRWVKPKLVCEVKFAEWTAAGLMRQPIFEGLRDDKRPDECRFEWPHEVSAEKAEAAETQRPKARKETDVSLEKYWKKRDFRQTKEPKGKVAKKRGKTVFVIHEHHASVMHFDLRLEIGGVLKSWSVPKGPTLDPGVKRLAIEVEDHPLDYANFDGTIPEGQYGAGRSLIWDEGRVTFDEADPLRAWESGSFSFALEGKKLQGEFALVRMKGRKGKPPWLLLKKDDAFAKEGWQLELEEPDKRFKPDAAGQKPSKTRQRSRSALAGRAKKAGKRQVTETEDLEKISVTEFLNRDRLPRDIDLKAGKYTVGLSSMDKLYWPKEKITKGDLIRYYLQIGETIMPYLKGRPAVLKRYPNGIDEDSFFQHDVTSAPPYLKTEPLENERGRKLNYAVYTDLASLIYLVNLGAISQHPWLSRVDNLDRPDYVVFDLDPKGAPFGNVLKLARLMKAALDDLELTGFVKTSGSSGIHVFIPIRRSYSFEQVMDWAEKLSKDIASRNPKIVTTARRLAEREKSQIYLDWQQNARGKTIAAPYTVRPRSKATVSAPVTWEEVEAGFKLTDFTIETMPGRIEEIGDLWKDLLRTRQTLPRNWKFGAK
jgi:bifunctional non-homologous end joining protein LigD